ncbi:MAG: glycosyltransferase [Sediminibacterium sp.]|nr:glycosyltransferase [Sediminibacterium sp.]MDP3129617.1 glycosyltransferase [Sediminibacterium sp.]
MKTNALVYNYADTLVEKNLHIDIKNEPVAEISLPEIVFITSYPPRECGIATYSQDLIRALNNKFNQSFRIRICPVESITEKHTYNGIEKYILNSEEENTYLSLATQLNNDPAVTLVLIQHEFGFYKNNEAHFVELLIAITKKVMIVFHTVLPNPNEKLKENVQQIANQCASIIVMTNSSANILINDYAIRRDKITVIPHGTHLVQHVNKDILKEKYGLKGRKIFSTFGLLSSGKGIETTLEALPAVVEFNKDILFLIIGITHPIVFKEEGEKYRTLLEEKVVQLALQRHVVFVNQFLPLSELLEYLQLTDIYIFTSTDPNQAVSGTFSYAIGSGCPIISTPIPHAKEVLKNNGGIIIDFGNPNQLSDAICLLLSDERLCKNISSNGLHRMAPTAWENSAIAHANLFKNHSNQEIVLQYASPTINLDHIKKMTTGFGMVQFSKLNQPDIQSGYTLDDNARAMIAICQHYELSKDNDDINYITRYLNFINYCLQKRGNFLNYVNDQEEFTDQNYTTNLEDSNGRAIWALGYLISLHKILPANIIKSAQDIMQNALYNVHRIHSTRAMAFVIKGLYYRNINHPSTPDIYLLIKFANRLVQMYRHEAVNDWQWFESYLTYANSILPEAMLCAWFTTGEPIYQEIANKSFNFLLSKIFIKNSIKVISNKGWLQKENIQAEPVIGGEQPIDVAYTIIALGKFYEAYHNPEYLHKIKIAFSWFQGNNHLTQIIYNPCTGGCYDGLEDNYVNINQGAESTVSYLMAKLTLTKAIKTAFTN